MQKPYSNHAEYLAYRRARKQAEKQPEKYHFEAFQRASPEALRIREEYHQRLSETDLTPNHVVLGDPPPWRSALAQRKLK
jgi:hypothetical protein